MRLDVNKELDSVVPFEMKKGVPFEKYNLN